MVLQGKREWEDKEAHTAEMMGLYDQFHATATHAEMAQCLAHRLYSVQA